MSIVSIQAARVQPVAPYNPAVAYLDRVCELIAEARQAAFAACLENEGPLPCPAEFAGTSWQRDGWAQGCDNAAWEASVRYDTMREQEEREDAAWAAFAKAHAVAWDGQD